MAVWNTTLEHEIEHKLWASQEDSASENLDEKEYGSNGQKPGHAWITCFTSKAHRVMYPHLSKLTTQTTQYLTARLQLISKYQPTDPHHVHTPLFTLTETSKNKTLDFLSEFHPPNKDSTSSERRHRSPCRKRRCHFLHGKQLIPLLFWKCVY
jgi:hypothetical protein